MIAALITISILCILLLLVAVVGCIFGYRSVKSNFIMQEQMLEYRRFFAALTETLVADTQFLRSEVIKDLPMDIPKYSKLNGEIMQFEHRIVQFREALGQMEMIDD